MNRLIGNSIRTAPFFGLCHGSLLQQPVRSLHQRLPIFPKLTTYTEIPFNRAQPIGNSLQKRHFSLTPDDILYGIGGVLSAVGYLPLIMRVSLSIKDEKTMLGILRTQPSLLDMWNAHPSLTSNKSFMLKAVEIDSSLLRYASYGIQNDPEFVLAALSNPSGGDWTMKYAGERLKADKAFMLEAIKLSPSAFGYADASIRAEEEVALAALAGCPTNLKHVDTLLLRNKKFMEDAMKVMHLI
jgi:hypothetical protein